MEDPTLAYEDMLFFERRLTEVISGMQPKVRKWKALLMIFLLLTAYTAYYWISDPSLKIITFWESLMLHPMFTASTSALLILFIFFGVHKRVVSPRIIATRCRSVLSDFCLSCDDSGKLIVRPAYSPTVSSSSSLLTPKSHHSQPAMSSSFGGTSSGGALNLVENEEILVDSPDNRLRTF